MAVTQTARPRHARWRSAATALIPLGTLAVLLVVSGLTGPSFAELERLRAVSAAEAVVLDTAAHGAEALSAPAARAVYDSFGGRGTGFVLLGAWSKLSIGRVGLLDPLSASRLPWLVLNAFGPLMLYLLVRPSRGRLAGWLAAGLLAFLPRWLHGAVVGEEAVALGSIWLAVLAAHARALAPVSGATRARPLYWALLAALALALGAALSLAALWILPLLVLHFWVVRNHELRNASSAGMLPLPGSVVVAAAVVPPALFASNPALWGKPAAALVRWTLAPLGPRVVATQYAGDVVSAPPLPSGYAASWLLQTLPAVVVVCALIGLALLFHRGLARRFASGSLRPSRDRHGLASLVLIGLVGCVVGPALTPELLVRFPPRVELALPFVAVAAALGLVRVSRVALPRAPAALAAGVVVLVAVLALRAPSTNSAAFDLLLGGARRASAGAFQAGDGSELSVMAEHIDGLRQSQVSLTAPGVPPDLWAVLREADRMRTVVATGARGENTLALERGPGTGDAIAEVQRDGVALWRLTAR